MCRARNLSGKVLGTALAAAMIAGTWVQAAVDAFITIEHEGFTPGTAQRGETIHCACLATTNFDMSAFTLVLTHDTGMLNFESVSFANGVWSNADYVSATLDNFPTPAKLTVAAVADTTNSGKLVPGGMNQPFFDAVLDVGLCTGPTTIGFGSGENDNILVDTNAIGHYLANTDLMPATIDIVPGGTFIRGNARNDPIDVSRPLSAAVNILDGVFLLDYLYAGGPAPGCLDAADSNNDGRINVVDPIVVFQEVFGNVAVAIPAPFDSFGVDTGLSLGCVTPPVSVGCAISPCDAGFADCDGITANGCETNLNTSLANCGRCGGGCVLANATATCVAGVCVIASCNAGFADCDGIAANGCETSLMTLANCGGCGVVCALANATATCVAGVCAIASCNAGFADCDGIAANGCETNLNTVSHCGGCGTSCVLANASATCVAGVCVIASCNAGFADCDGIAANGCETNLNTTVSHCGDCGTSCVLPHARSKCVAGVCVIASCDFGYRDCDGIDANGCETSGICF